MTRKVSAHLFNSVNGVVESPNEWQFDRFGPEEMEMMGAAIGGVTDVVIGRKLWDEWSEYWQTVGPDDPFGRFINPVRKHVVSSTRSGDLGWNSTVIEGDAAAHVRALKETDGGGISVVGGIDTTRSLFLAGVIDELTLTTHPVAGVGRRLFDETVPVTRLDLVRSQVTSVGNAVLTYALHKT
jgi:dihydrofolate reductase